MYCDIKEDGNSHLQYIIQKLSGHRVGHSESHDLCIVSLWHHSDKTRLNPLRNGSGTPL